MGSVIKYLRVTICLLCFVFLSSSLLLAFPGDEGRARIGSSAKARPRQSLPRPEMRIPKLAPELEQFLKNWHTHSKKVKKLEGKHYRFVYDAVFQTEKRASGLFYYESPDKARMDIEPAKLINGQVSSKKNKKGRPYTIKKDKQTRWISDGKQIMAVNEEEKTYEVHAIPPNRQGKNIMDGPLPFLFGMPPDKAKLRYGFKLLKETKDKVILAVRPKWRQDAANWREAKVIISKTNYLPTAVQLINPAGNLETVYQFHDLKVNKRAFFFIAFWGPDPFRKPGYPYKEVKLGDRRPAKGQQPIAEKPRQNRQMKKDQALVPSVVGISYKEAEQKLKQAGFAAQLRKGSKTANKKLFYHVERQQPPGKTPYQKGQTVVITLYIK